MARQHAITCDILKMRQFVLSYSAIWYPSDQSHNDFLKVKLEIQTSGN